MANIRVIIYIPDDPEIVVILAGDWRIELSEVYRELLKVLAVADS